MPHKGVEYVHMNLQEIRGDKILDTAMPLLDNNILVEIKTLLGSNMSTYFYEVGEALWWFRIDFLKKIQNIQDKNNTTIGRNI